MWRTKQEAQTELTESKQGIELYNVIQKALEHCGPKEHHAIGNAILSVPGSVLTLRCSRYGRHCVRALTQVLPPLLREEALRQLSAGTPKHEKNPAPIQQSMALASGK